MSKVVRPDPELTESIIRRFWEYTIQGNGCWGWRASVNRQGYGRIWASDVGYTYGAHRLSLLIHKGYPEPGQIAMHSCDNPECVNPDHLSWATHLENTRDKFTKRRANLPLGSQHKKAKLTEDSIAAIRAKAVPVRILADQFGVSVTSIYRVLKGETWAHV